jgi:cytochrome c peroxidase
MKRVRLPVWRKGRRWVLIFVSCIAAAVLWQVLQPNPAQIFMPAPTASTVQNEPIQPIPLQLALNPNKVKLGKSLFHNPQLSKNNTISCASCHLLNRGGVDGLEHAIGINNAVGQYNTPTVFNSGFNFRQFWDGRATTLEHQIHGPILSKGEMGETWAEIIRKLQRSPEYVNQFKQLYPDGINIHNIKDAIATFERSLYTPNSQFDRFLRGESTALSAEQQEGYRLFKSIGCVGCHQGLNIGGDRFAKFSVYGNYFRDRRQETQADLGRFNVTGNEYDRYTFKVPSLRNITLTAPYFHDGSAPTLEQAVSIMSQYQLNQSLSTQTTDLIVKFLQSLTGKYEGQPLANN